jgi:hypothetical protein
MQCWYFSRAAQALDGLLITALRQAAKIGAGVLKTSSPVSVVSSVLVGSLVCSRVDVGSAAVAAADFPPLSVAATANGVDIIQNLLQIENECEPLSLFALIAIS